MYVNFDKNIERIQRIKGHNCSLLCTCMWNSGSRLREGRGSCGGRCCGGKLFVHYYSTFTMFVYLERSTMRGEHQHVCGFHVQKEICTMKSSIVLLTFWLGFLFTLLVFELTITKEYRVMKLIPYLIIEATHY